jgi:hypothetical protein
MRTGIVRRFALIAALATVSLGLECAPGPLDAGLGPSTNTVAGTWQGTIVTDLSMRLVLTESNNTVNGTGTMTELGVPFALTISGTSANGTFSLDIAEVQHAPFTFTGSVQLNGAVRTMVGVANGSGFTNQAITLTKQ